MGKDKEHSQFPKIPNLQSASGAGSLPTSKRPSRLGFVDKYAFAMENALKLRRECKMMHKVDGTLQDLTPFLLQDDVVDAKLLNLGKKLDDSEDNPQTLLEKSSSEEKFGINSNLTMSVSNYNFFASEQQVEEESDGDEDEGVEGVSFYQQPLSTPPFIKIVLRKTEEIILFQQRSITAIRGTIEAQQVEQDNKSYDFLTIGKGRMRRRTTSEAQTVDKLYKTRETNTPLFRSSPNAALVSNFLMFESFKYVDSLLNLAPVSDTKDVTLNTKTSRKNQMIELVKKSEFKLALMTTLRILAGNVLEEKQRRFRNLSMPDPIARDCEYKYSLNLLLRFNPQTMERNRKSVADLAFCPGNGDIIAVAYGIYSFGAMHVPENGYCCVWNIKNPVNPERKFFFNAAVVSVQFSPFTPQLLAIGLYDGRVEIYDISTFSETPVAVSLRNKLSTCDPVTALEWIPQGNAVGMDNAEMETLFALSQDGLVTKYRIINSPYLLAFKQIQLDRVEGSPEGLIVQRVWNQTQSNRFPQGLGIKKHPSQHDIYYILTDEGCIHKCSTNYPHQHLEVLQAHTGSVNEIDFSPWSPKIFLTAGNDWCIRIWMEGIFEPLITLRHEIGPIHCAAWSKTHSTVIVSNTRKTVNVWDIRRCVLKPVSSANIDKSNCTMFKFSRCGRSIALGNERGSVLIVGLDDMPFPPHFQYDELELAIYKAIATKPDLTTEVKSFGFFGYPDQIQNSRRKRSHHCTLMQ